MANHNYTNTSYSQGRVEIASEIHQELFGDDISIGDVVTVHPSSGHFDLVGLTGFVIDVAMQGSEEIVLVQHRPSRRRWIHLRDIILSERGSFQRESTSSTDIRTPLPKGLFR